MSDFSFRPEPPFCNPGKQEFVSYDNLYFACYAIRTPVIGCDTTPEEVFETYIRPYVRPDDIVFCSEKMIACAQGRAILLTDIKPSPLACFLSRFVTRSPYGIGLAMPETMQCALEECGYLRILLAAAAGALGRCLGKKGWFYRIAGKKAASIDGPCSYTLPPYNRYVVPGPTDVRRTAKALSAVLGGNPVLIVDANDLGCRVLASSARMANRCFEALLAQNPLGQSTQCTPVGILRPVKHKNT